MNNKNYPDFKKDLSENLFRLAYGATTEFGKASLLNYMSQVQFLTQLTFEQQALIVKEHSLATYEVIVDITSEKAAV